MADSTYVLGELRRDCEQASLREVAAASARPEPAPVAPTLDYIAQDNLRDTMFRRQSERFFTVDPVEAQLLTTMIRAAREADAALWTRDAERRPLEFYVVARTVTGLAPAVYRDANGRLEFTASIPAQDGISAMVLQPEFGLAAALVLVVGSLEDALEAHGSHGHRLLLERSGAASAAAWLTAVHRGLGGSIFAGFLPSALKTLVGIDGFRRSQLLAVAVGSTAAANVVARAEPCDTQTWVRPTG